VPVVADPGVSEPIGPLRASEVDLFDDLHVEARRVLERNPEPRNARDVAVALESMGYTKTAARRLGYRSVFDLAAVVFRLAYLYYVPVRSAPEPPRRRWQRLFGDYLTGSWYGVPWIMSVVVLFAGRMALWSSLDTTRQVASIVSLAFFLAAALAGAVSQMLARRGTFYFLQRNMALVRWTLQRVLLYGVATAVLAIAASYAFFVVPTYGLSLSFVYLEFSVVIFAFLVATAPLYMLRRFHVLAAATGIALLVSLGAAKLFGHGDTGVRHAQLLGMAVASGAMVLMVASFVSFRRKTNGAEAEPTGAASGGTVPGDIVAPPELRVVLWHLAPYALYGFAYFALILVDRIVTGFAYGHALGLDQYYYPSTYEGSVDLALLELVVLLGIVHALVERFARQIVPLLERYPLDRWRQVRRELRRYWIHSVLGLAGVAAVAAVFLPTAIVHLLPSFLTVAVRAPGGMDALRVASVGYALVPVGMLSSQYLFFLGRPRAPVLAAVLGACTSLVIAVVLTSGGRLDLGSWGLLAGAGVYALVAGLASWRAISAGEESFYASF